MREIIKKTFKYLVTILLFCSLSSCRSDSINDQEKNYKDYIANHISWNEIFTQEPLQYFVYFYDESCLQCEKVKPIIFKSIDTNKYEIYLINTKLEVNTVFGNDEILGSSNISDFMIRGTPTFIEIYDKKVDVYLAGYNDIVEFLSVVFLP